MPWLKISVEAAGASAEALSERMLACGALSVSFGASGVIGGEVLEPPPGAAPLWPRVTVSGLFPSAVDAQALNSALGGIGASRIDWLGDQDWAAPRSGDVPKLRFGDSLVVVPREASSRPFHEANAQPLDGEGVPKAQSRAGRPRSADDAGLERGPLERGRPALETAGSGRPAPVDGARTKRHAPERGRPALGRRAAPFLQTAVLRLDPGLAFGTGQHPTTASCLAWLADARLEGRSVLDYGCGSGILAIAAALLGAARVVAVDIEPQALSATQANADFNGVALDAVTTPEELQTRQRRRPAIGRSPGARADSSDNLIPRSEGLRQPGFDVVLANILANTLIELAPTLSGCMNAGGQLVLAGLLEPQIDAVTSAYPSLAFDPPSIDGEWARLTGRRRD